MKLRLTKNSILSKHGEYNDTKPIKKISFKGNQSIKVKKTTSLKNHLINRHRIERVSQIYNSLSQEKIDLNQLFNGKASGFKLEHVDKIEKSNNINNFQRRRSISQQYNRSSSKNNLNKR